MPTDFDYEDRPERYRRGMELSRAHLAEGTDLYDTVAARLSESGAAVVLDLGCASGRLAAAVARSGVSGTTRVLGIDLSWPLLVEARRHGPVARGSVAEAPIRDAACDAVVVINVLDHLEAPSAGLREAHRVLRPGGLLIAGAISRHDSPELAAIWKPQNTPFDSEDAPRLVEAVFGNVRVEAWDAQLLSLPHARAVSEYLQARFVTADRADRLATTFARDVTFPLRVTKRGALIFAHRQGAETVPGRSCR